MSLFHKPTANTASLTRRSAHEEILCGPRPHHRVGRIRFTTADGNVEAGPGTLLACDADVKHAVEALGDVVRLISVATGGDTGNPG